ncbi:hypothetical protein CLCR_07798 [Cladophialophora carrionii]|uniref:Uncharacterized protein n=1 Tax=Cladophialophora carrionii TaxID=86049 RepID=A0A1C1CPS4_9EURO|nr:hypothetical protein CLCR_07798 [Cladophialophora carrionii]
MGQALKNPMFDKSANLRPRISMDRMPSRRHVIASRLWSLNAIVLIGENEEIDIIRDKPKFARSDPFQTHILHSGNYL